MDARFHSPVWELGGSLFDIHWLLFIKKDCFWSRLSDIALRTQPLLCEFLSELPCKKCIICYYCTKIFEFSASFKVLSIDTYLGVFGEGPYFALCSFISVFSTETFRPNHWHTSEKNWTDCWRWSSFSVQMQVSSTKISSSKDLFWIWIDIL